MVGSPRSLATRLALRLRSTGAYVSRSNRIARTALNPSCEGSQLKLSKVDSQGNTVPRSAAARIPICRNHIVRRRPHSRVPSRIPPSFCFRQKPASNRTCSNQVNRAVLVEYQFWEKRTRQQQAPTTAPAQTSPLPSPAPPACTRPRCCPRPASAAPTPRSRQRCGTR